MSRDALNEEERSGPKAWRVKGPRCVEYSFFEGQKDGQRLEGRSDSSGVGSWVQPGARESCLGPFKHRGGKSPK